MEWQPIETAPKDGTQIITCVAGHETSCTVWWDDLFESWWIGDERRLKNYKPTHWMPMPTPPACEYLKQHIAN